MSDITAQKFAFFAGWEQKKNTTDSGLNEPQEYIVDSRGVMGAAPRIRVTTVNNERSSIINLLSVHNKRFWLTLRSNTQPQSPSRSRCRFKFPREVETKSQGCGEVLSSESYSPSRALDSCSNPSPASLAITLTTASSSVLAT